MIRRLLLSSAIVLSLLSACEAQPFLPQDCTALVNLLPAPPSPESPAGRADLETLLQVQSDRTPEQVARAKRVASQTVTSFARPVFGDWFSSRDFPKTMAIFKEIDRETQKVVDGEVKRRWNRTRPYIYSSAIHPVVGKPDNTSYPSGHSAAAAVWGTILSAAFPEKADQFKSQIHEVMWCRVLGGAHYPSDTEAGAMLGEAIANKMLESPEMQEALETMRKEIGPHLAAKSQVTQSLPSHLPN